MPFWRFLNLIFTFYSWANLMGGKLRWWWWWWWWWWWCNIFVLCICKREAGTISHYMLTWKIYHPINIRKWST